MNFDKQLRRMERLDRMLQNKSTGTPKELAQKLQLSPSQVYQIIRSLKCDLNAPIYYSRTEQSYCYKENVHFVCAFKEKNI
jgi:predicted DNA-binding transcriptional regulator YafY